MSNKSTSEILLERLVSTSGLAVRNSAEDEVFWYTSEKPGPFYMNTEKIAGKVEAGEILQQINKILGDDCGREQMVRAIFDLFVAAVNADPAYKTSIDALAAYYLEQRRDYPAIISGGERRDWFFSIPLARYFQVPHLFLFKNGDLCITDHEGNLAEIDLQDWEVLHVADIINQASSYLKRWIPILRKSGARFTETMSVAVRSEEGITQLREQSVSVISPLLVDIPLFEEACRLGLIGEFALNEIKLFDQSPKDWTAQYIRQVSANAAGQWNEDPVKRARIQAFRQEDPYHLKHEFPWYFT